MIDGEVCTERKGDVLFVTFDRPAARNAMTWQMYEQLGAVCTELKNDASVRAVVFRGAGGKAFIAGTDIAQFTTFTSGEDGIAYEEKMERYLAALEALPMPTLAVIEGFAIGGGLAIAACCDLRIATPGSRFGVPIARTLGNCLSVANYARVVAALGVPRAKKMLLLAENLTAEEALAGGFLLDIVPPTVQVTTTYPGASAETVVNTIALPIELQVNGVSRMIYMNSTSTDAGTYTLTVTFEIGTDLDFAQVLVQNRVSAALASLPQSVQAQGVVVQKKSTSILEIVALTSPDGRYDSLFMGNYATINLVNELARLPGVGNVNVLGVGKYSMRIWMDPDKLYSYGLGPTDVIQAIKSQNQSVTAGQVGMPPADKGQNFQYTLDIEGLLLNPEQFGQIIRDESAKWAKLIKAAGLTIQ